jgi:type IX secretion system PorP/SprF family membrane protein
MMKKLGITIAAIALIGAQEVSGQQMAQFSQYMFNDYLVNPAIGGSRPYFDVKTNNRYQWVGITDAPRTFTLSVHGPTKNRKMGLGGLIYTDIVGPTRRIGMQFSYSYHLQLNENLRLSFGVAAGLQQFAVDGSKITTHDPGDAVISSGYQSAIVPDAKFGVYLYSLDEKLFFGVSFPQIMQNKLYFFESQNATESRLEDHYYAMGGYRFDVGDDFKIEPSVLVKYVAPVPVKVDIMARVIYQDKVWIGGGYRTNDAFSAMVGYLHRNNLMIGYSYDFTTTNLKNYSDGTHELMLGIRFVRATSTSKSQL